MNYKRITVETLSKIAIGLCILLAIAIFIGTFQNSAFKRVSDLSKYITELKDKIVYIDNRIEQAEAEIADEQEKLPGLSATKTAADKKLSDAKVALQTVCSRSYYSFYFCSDPSICNPLHTAVSNATSEQSSAANKLENCEDAIDNAKATISNSTQQKAELNDEIKELTVLKVKALFSAFFMVVAMLLTIAGIVVLILFLLDRTNNIKGLIACGLLAVSSIVYMILPTATYFVTYLLGIAILGIFAALIADKIHKRIVARVFIIIIALILFALTLLTAPISALITAITFILISVILVPCVFTEYLDIAKHIFFTIITFGIWHLIWMYNFTENLNKVERAEKRAPIRELILCTFLPLYFIFWIYKTAGNTELYAEEKGMHFKIDVLCFALSVICPLLATVIIQDKTNMIVGQPIFETAPTAQVVEEASEDAKAEE